MLGLSRTELTPKGQARFIKTSVEMQGEVFGADSVKSWVDMSATCW